MNGPFLNVGHGTETARELKQAVMDILNARADQKTIREALKTLQKGLGEIKNTTISNCTMAVNEVKPEVIRALVEDILATRRKKK
jgi:acyl-CoA hydrolase